MSQLQCLRLHGMGWEDAFVRVIRRIAHGNEPGYFRWAQRYFKPVRMSSSVICALRSSPRLMWAGLTGWKRPRGRTVCTIYAQSMRGDQL